MAKEKFNLYNTLLNRTASADADSFASRPKNLKNFFPIMWQNFSRLFYANLFFTVGNFPIFFLILAASGIVSDRGLSPQSSMFGNYFGALNYTGFNPVSAALGGVHGVQVEVNVPGTATKVFFLLSLLLLLTFGIINAAISLSFREMLKGEPVYFFGNLKRAFKEHTLKTVVLGALDLALMLLIAYDIVLFYVNASTSVMMSIFLGISLVIALLYLGMRMYMYLLLDTFKLSIPKIIKNSFIFSIVGLKRNILAILFTALAIGLNYLILNLYMPIGIILPFIITVGVIEFSMCYAAWPKIKEVMIDPYYNEDGSVKKEEN